MPKILAAMKTGIGMVTAPLARWGARIGPVLAKMFPKLSWLAVGLKKAAIPLTIVMEAIDTLRMIFGGSGGFLQNAQEMSDTINSKGTFGRAVHGLVHSVTTITTFLVDFGKMLGSFPAAIEVLFNEIAESFRGLMHNMRMSFFEAWDSIVNSTIGKFLRLEHQFGGYGESKRDQINQNYQMERMERAIKQGYTEEKGKEFWEKLKKDAAKKNLHAEEGESLPQFLDRVSKASIPSIKKSSDQSTTPNNYKLTELEKILVELARKAKERDNTPAPTQTNNTKVDIYHQWMGMRPTSNFYDLDATLHYQSQQ
tara:strand:+ start:146 stop:1078 length:933 start_codon:yes stop_codon:yes gene_type:complete